VRTILECAAAAIVAGREEMKDEALARGVARYHPETGDWEWTVDPTSPASPR
jgi:hypothetical protein